MRVWFARLQMPVLRVAVTEPDFFATVDHPARRLIDRMGACVMGFDTSTRSVGDALEKEIKRVVQVVEAYPDTGRRVFQTVLTEFEKFLEHYFSTENEATRKGVSLAQQVEQRETMAIQYTIELRRMLNEVPVQESVRAFLFQVWADVLATTAVRYGAQGEETRAMKRAASDLIWSASAKVTREERAEVIRRLTPLLKTLRDGMSSAGMDPARQDEHIQILNNSLAAAFTAKAPVIPHERLQELAERLESLEELLPDAADVTIDDSIVFDLSGHESSELEVVSEGGSMPTPAMIAWARELQVGGWYMLDYRDRNEAVQLAWLGMRKQLSMFVTPQGRCVLFQQQRLASFLQAGLLLPAQDESLSVRATRSALAKLDVDPSRLLELRARSPRAAAVQWISALFGRDEQLVEDQRVGLFAQAPEDHQHDDLQVVQFDRPVADGGRAVDHHLAHRRRQHAGRFEEADEADRFLAQQLVLGLGIDAQALFALLAGAGFGAAGQAVEPLQRVLDLVGLEADRGQLPRQLLVARAGVRAPVVFVQIHEHFEHENTIAQPAAALAAVTCAARSGVAAALVQAAGQARDAVLELQLEQPGAQLLRAPAGARAQRVQRHRVVAQRLQQRVVAAVGAARAAPAAAMAARSCSSSRMSSALSTSLAPWRISAWQPRDSGEWIEPGIAKTSRPVLGRQPRGDQRARLQRRLDHQRAARQAGNDAVAHREVLRQRRRARREFADQHARPWRCGAPARGAAPGRPGPARCRPPPPCCPARPGRLRARRRRCRGPGRRRWSSPAG